MAYHTQFASQAHYDRFDEKMKGLKKALKQGILAPDEFIDVLVFDMQYSEGMARRALDLVIGGTDFARPEDVAQHMKGGTNADTRTGASTRHGRTRKLIASR